MTPFVRLTLGALLIGNSFVSAQTLSIVSGDGQVVLENFSSTSPLVVQAKDSSGNPMAGVRLEWSVPFGQAGLLGTQNVTDATGRAQAYFIAASLLDLEVSVRLTPVTVVAPFGQVQFRITTALYQQLNGQPAPPPSVELLSPRLSDGPLVGKGGSVLSRAVAIRVSVVSGPQAGEVLPNVGMRLVSAIDLAQPVPVSCAGPNGMAFTGADGIADCSLVLANEPGSYRISAYVGESVITPWFRVEIQEGNGSGGGDGEPVPVSITTSSLPSGRVGQAYQTRLAAVGGTPPYAWSATGSVPAGLNLNSATGVLSGTPTSATTTQFTVKVTDNVGANATRTLTLSVTSDQPLPTDLTIVTESLPAGVEGASYFAAILVQGGHVTPFNPGQVLLASGSLPPGLELSGKTIRGTPSESGNYEFTLEARDAFGAAVQRAFVIVINQTGGEPPPMPISVTPVSLTFEAGPGGDAPPTRTLELNSAASQGYNATTTTTSGGDWLEVTPQTGSTPAVLSVSIVSPVDLDEGTYLGEVIVQPVGGGAAATRVPVTLVVSGPPELLIAPLSLSFEIREGAPPPTQQVISIGSSGGPVNFEIVEETETDSEWLLAAAASAQTPSYVFVAVSPYNLAPGTYRGSLRIQQQGGVGTPAEVSVVLTIPQPAPRANAVTNAGSFLTGPVSAGQIVVIFGSNMGPSELTRWRLDNQGEVARELSDTQVFFDGRRAPIIYTWAQQISVVVPDEVAGSEFTTLKVAYRGLESDPVELPVAAAAPSIFTLDGVQGAILNQNYSVNGAGNGAVPGEVIMIFGTGAGISTGCSDGMIVPFSPLPEPVLPVGVTVGGKEAFVQYAGGSPGLPCGVLQVNAYVPDGIPPGPTPISIEVAGVESQPEVTVSIKAAQ